VFTFSRGIRDSQYGYSEVKHCTKQGNRVMVIQLGSKCVRWLLLLATLSAMTITAVAQEAENVVERKPLWSFEEAQAQLRMYPKDVFLQYVALKLGQRDGFDATELLGLNEPTRRQIAAERRENVDLFNLFSASLAVQESLQLDAMRPGSDFNRENGGPNPGASIQIQTLSGPTVESHPWHEMLKGKKPKFSVLANYVPADNYYIRFRSVSRMLDIIDGGNLFAKHLYTQTGEQAFARDTEQKLRQQLAVETNPLARPFYDLVVKEIAISGSDPFVNEGSDVTLLFRFDQDLVFRTQMDAYLAAAEKSIPNVIRKEETWEGTAFVHITSPDRDVHVFSAYPAKGLHVRSNSRTTFLRVLKLIQGKSDKSLMSLGKSEEFAYVRTLMPADAPDEDGLIYLSDPFIRRLVGPELKLTELRRLKCFNNLRMIGHAAVMYETENGHGPASMKDLQDANCLPDGFNPVGSGPIGSGPVGSIKGRLQCACGGEYSLSRDGRHGVCSHHGHADALIPCCEIPETSVTTSEADAYRQFVTEYSQYWRTFFDPIAIKVQATPERYRLETIVLPLINNSIYQSMAMALGGEPKPLAGIITSDSVMSLSFAIAKQRLLEQSGWQPPEEIAAEQPKEQSDLASMRASSQHLKQIGLAAHNYHDTHNQFPAFSRNESGRPLLSWRVMVLPCLEQAALYSEFHLDEPWDSPHNKTLIGRMPDIFKSPGAKSSQPGMTTYQTVMGDDTIFEANGGKVSASDVTDGMSNTVMVIDASPEFETIWTKPGDLMPDTAKMRKALEDRFNNGGLILLADGSRRQLRRGLDDAAIMNIFSRNDGQVIGDVFEESFDAFQSRRQDPFGLKSVMGGRIEEGDLYKLLSKGLGDRVGLHVCDSDPTFDVQLTSILPEMFAGRQGAGNMMGDEVLWIGMAIASLTSPVYIDLAVEDAAVVDAFLAKLDEGAAIEARTHTDLGWFAFRKDFYTVQIGDTKARSFVLSLGPIKWRFFYTRIGGNVCIASKLQTLEQLVAMHADNPPAQNASGSPAHAQVTIHRQQWNRIVPSVRLSWDEAARQACLDNIGPLTSAARVAAGSHHDVPEVPADELVATALSIYGGVHRCPCGGHYVLTKDGRIACSVHGDADQPQQPAPNAANGGSLEMLNSFSEIRVLLTFLEDGLHAVLEIDRQ